MSEPPERRTLELVSIPSPTAHEEELCARVEAWARDRDGGATLRRWRNCLTVQAPPTGRPAVGLFGHLDTVAPSHDQPLGIQDGRVYGCGASDMKAGLALMMQAWEERDRWDADLVLVFYDREEGPSEDNGLAVILPELPAMDLAVVLEPTDNQVQLGCVGSLHARVTFSGRRAHSARPWQGENALFKAIPLLQRLERMQPRAVEVDGLTFYEVVTPTTAVTGNSRNVVPDRFELNVNYRFAPGRTPAEARVELAELVGTQAHLEVLDVAPAGDVCSRHPRVSEWIARGHLGTQPKQAWTDVARLTAAGIPAVNFGPGDPGQAHQAREHVTVDALYRGYELLSLLLLSS
ncbi:MAG: succinyl-diaminopimelate desuccinylase [Candidatus Eremiobacterota bacterium]